MKSNVLCYSHFTKPLFCLALSLCALASLAQSKFTDPPAITLNSVSLDTGVTLQYAEQGSGHRNVVILLHGYLDSWYSFSNVMPILPPAYHVIALTQRGHGDSSKPEDHYEMVDFSEDVVAFMDHFGYNKASLVGHSMGCMIAERFAIDHPDRIDKLIMIGSAVDITKNDLLQSVADQLVDLEDPLDRDFVYDFQAGTASNPISAEFIDGIVDESLKIPAATWRAALAGLLRANTTGELEQITAPSLLLWGAHDGIFSRDDQQELLDHIPDITYVEFANLNHSIQWEQPRLVAYEIAAFLRARANSNPSNLVPKR